ncbi:MAG: hypothetical protein QOJ65_297, partial [Fimbriimonadaceae bacterium]|nr:hypothetical protein [Fimbriimonadaceae bacterium]
MKQSALLKIFLAAAPWTGLLVPGLLLEGKQDRIEPARVSGGAVNGSVGLLELPGDAPIGNMRRIVFLPDFNVQLRNTKTRALSAPEKTDLYGRYYFPRQAPGVYQLTWPSQNGWAAGASKEPLVIHDETVFPSPVGVAPTEGLDALIGKVTFSDGTVPFFQDEYFGITNTATVSLSQRMRIRARPQRTPPARTRLIRPLQRLPLSTIARAARANFMGEFAIPYHRSLPVGLNAVDEAVTTSRTIPATQLAQFSMQGTGTATLVLKNRKPSLESAFVFRGREATRLAPLGATMPLSAQATDLDGDPLTFQWKLPSTAGSLGNFNTNAERGEWSVPPIPGDYKAYVVVRDGKGGYARGNVVVKVGQTEGIFAGRVVDDSGNVVAGATVEINGTTTKTNTNGAYDLRVPLADRYVMNIVQTGFAHFSRIFHGDVRGQVWRLVAVQTVANLDATTDVTLVDTRPILSRKERRGARIIIGANSLVREDGNPIQPPLTAEIATLDIANAEAPGDWGAIENGREVNLVSYGCVFVEVRDATGAKCNLAPNQTAQVELPAPRSLLRNNAPAQTPFWSYDETDGYWKVAGNATLDTAGQQYRGSVKHFSTINTDLSKTDAACLRIVLGPSIPTGVQIRVSDPTGTNFSQTPTFVANDVVNAVYRLLPNIDVKLDVIDSSGNVIADVVAEQVLGTKIPTRVVNTGNAIPPGHSLWPPPPYDDCKTIYLSRDIPNSNGDFLVFKGPGSSKNTQRYYTTVDPQNLRPTLGDWWQANGFDPTNGAAADSVNVAYLNNNDLGSGRGMHFRPLAGGGVAAYVTNYGGFDQNPHNADDAASNTSPGATVCMEYSPIEGPTPGSAAATGATVKFFVFNGGVSGAARVESADLDGNGQKFVPNLCMNCHGGNYTPNLTVTNPPATEGVLQARFRELDYTTYKFPGGRSAPNAAEMLAFHLQNNMVKGAAGDSISTTAIKDLITGWYTGAPDEQVQTYAPTGWKVTAKPQNEQLYHDVDEKSSRTCHIGLSN